MADGDEHTVATPSPGAVAAVNVKLPPYWASDPQVWFAQVEATFTTRRITSEKTHSDYVITSLSPKVATEIRDLILKPPEATPYMVLNSSFAARLHQNNAAFSKCSTPRSLGITNLHNCYAECSNCLVTASTTDNTFLRKLFLQRLPSKVRMVLASTSTTGTLEELAELADKVVEVAAPTDAATSASPCPKIITEIEQLWAEVQKLQTSVRQLTQ